jgi:hypothetical protein
LVNGENDERSGTALEDVSWGIQVLLQCSPPQQPLSGVLAIFDGRGIGLRV